MKFAHMWGHARKPTCKKFFYPTPQKNLAGKTSNFAELPPTCGQSEACNFEAAQHIVKQKPDISSTINALKKGTKLRASPHGV